MWGGKCPFGSQCSKRSATLKTCHSYEDAVESIVHHLVTSPYHELERSEAESAVDFNLIESWEIDKKKWAEEQDRWQKKQRKSLPWQPTAEPAISAPPTGAGTGRITLSEMQVRACVDSLKRAKVSAESAANLCAKAARAFNEEVTCIQQCVEVIESYVQPTRVLPLR